MNLISAQPDERYFIWQLMVQMNNFRKHEIEEDAIVLLGYNNEPSKEAKDFSKKTKARVEFIKDERPDKSYVSSIRPFLLTKFFSKNPDVEEYFYHDCDILFIDELPNFKYLSGLKSITMSDTVSYIGSSYIKRKSEELFEKMCGIVGIDKEIVENNEKNSGGAQYFMKINDYSFWDKVYSDSTHLYNFMTSTRKLYSPEHPIQAWTADMWAVLWNIWLWGYKTKVHDELEFTWANQNKEKLKENKIFHNAGIVNQKGRFNKSNFRNKYPFHEDFSYVDKNSASYFYVQEIIDTKNNF